MAVNGPKLRDWLKELKHLKETYGSDVQDLCEQAKRTIEMKMKELLKESHTYMKTEEIKVRQLIREKKVFVPADIKWPVPLETPVLLQHDSRFSQRNIVDETTSMVASLGLRMSSIVSSVNPQSQSDRQTESCSANLTPDIEVPVQLSVDHSLIPRMKDVGDVVYNQGLTLFTAPDDDLTTINLFQWKSNESNPVRISASFDCLNLCLSGSEELLAPEFKWKKDEREFCGTNRVRRFQLMKEFESKPIELEGFYEVEGGKDLRDLASSSKGFVAVCDYALKRITVHSTEPWIRADTIDIDPLFVDQLRSIRSSNDNHLRPVRITWIDSDRICVKMADGKTIICVSLRYKQVLWAQAVTKADLLSAGYKRLFVSHTDQPARFTVLQADSGKIISNETIHCPRARWSLKVFESPTGAGRMIAFSC